jgi:hypothetical protein
MVFHFRGPWDRMGSNFNSWKILRSPTSGKIYYLIYSDLPLLEIYRNIVQASLPRPLHNKKNDDFIFCLFWYAQQQNPYNL